MKIMNILNVIKYNMKPALLMAAMAFSANSMADDHEGKGHGKGKGFMKCFKETLKPTDEQMTKVQALMQAQRAKRKDRSLRKKDRAEMDKARQDLQAAIKGDASSSTLRKLNAKILELRESRRTVRFENFLAIREILSSEQRAKMGECGGPLGFKMREHSRDGKRSRDGKSKRERRQNKD